MRRFTKSGAAEEQTNQSTFPTTKGRHSIALRAFLFAEPTARIFSPSENPSRIIR
jgi:hypothetical protein